MSIYSNVTEQDLINLRKLAEQQKNERAQKIKIKILKQTHDIKLAESLSPITKKLDETIKKVRDILKESNSENENNQAIVFVEIESEDENFQTNLRALPNSSMFSDQMTKTLGRLMSSSNSLRIKPSPSGATILGVPITTLGVDRIQIKDNIYDLTPEIFKALSYTGYAGNTMKNGKDTLMLNNIKNDLGYTGVGDYSSKRKTFLTKTLPRLVEEIQNRTFEEITDNSDLEGQGIEKIIIPSNIIDIYSRSEILLGLKLSGHTDTLTEASNLIDELYKRGEIQNKQQYRNALDKFTTKKMELPTKLLEQIAFNTRSKMEEHMLTVMYKSTHEEHLLQPLQTNNKQFKIAVTFLFAFNGIFKVTNSNIKFYFFKSVSEDDHIQISVRPGVYEIESSNKELKRINITEEHYTQANYPFKIKPDFNTLGSIIEISPQGPVISFAPNDSIGELLGFNKITIYEEYNISPNPVDIISFDNIFIDCDIARGRIYRSKQSNIIHNWTMTVNPGYKYVERFFGGITW